MERLPTELLVIIIKHLDARSRLSLNGVNKRLRIVNLSIEIPYIKLGEVLPYTIERVQYKDNRNNNNFKIGEKKFNRLLLNLKMFPGIRYLSFDISFKTYDQSYKARDLLYVYSTWQNIGRRVSKGISPILNKLNRKKGSTLQKVQCIEYNTRILSGYMGCETFEMCENLKCLIINSNWQRIKLNSTIEYFEVLQNLELFKFTGFLYNQEEFVNYILPKCFNLKYFEAPHLKLCADGIRQKFINTIVDFKQLRFLKLDSYISTKEYISLLKALDNLDHIDVKIWMQDCYNLDPYRHNNLKSMVLKKTDISYFFKTVLLCAPNLQSLDFHETSVIDEEVEDILTILPQLRYLSLGFTQNASNYLITGCPNLEIVHLYLGFMNENLLSILEQFIDEHKKLKLLILSRTNIFEKSKFNFTQLEMMVNERCKIKCIDSYWSDKSYLPSKYNSTKDYIQNYII